MFAKRPTKSPRKSNQKIFITDGLPTYSITAKPVFPNANHIRKIAFDGKVHNNKMERMDGEIRDREKTMRGLKTKDTAILTGYQLFHNYFRPHEALDGKTPSEACGIQIEGNTNRRTKQMAYSNTERDQTLSVNHQTVFHMNPKPNGDFTEKQEL